MPIRRVTSMPPRLSGTVGKSAINRPHDVALVQALLGEVKDRGRPLFKGQVSGRFDRDTLAVSGAGFSLGEWLSEKPYSKVMMT